MAVGAELGSGLIVDRAAAATERPALLLEDERPAPAAPGLELTPRERQVLGLIEQGLSSRQIGEQLFISAKTASVHISAILRKLGAATRTEAAFVAPQLPVSQASSPDPRVRGVATECTGAKIHRGGATSMGR